MRVPLPRRWCAAAARQRGGEITTSAPRVVARMSPPDRLLPSPVTETQSQRRVVVTGMGIVSCLGNTVEDVKASLHECKSGISLNEKYIEIGMKSHVSGKPDIDTDEFIDRKQGRFMGSQSAASSSPPPRCPVTSSGAPALSAAPQLRAHRCIRSALFAANARYAFIAM